MWKQIFNQIWNQRRTNAWLWTELCIVTVLLWYGVDVVYNYEGAAWQPKGYDTSCVFDLTMGTKPMDFINDADNRRAGEDFTYLYNLIKDYPGVEEVCAYYGSVPYTDEVMSEGYAPHTDSTHVVNCYIRYVTSSYFKVFRLNPLAGQLDEEHWSSAENPVPTLMSVDLVDSLFQLPHAADAVGRTCFNPYWLNTKHPVTNYRVSAVLPRHKLGDYERYEPFIYLPADKALFWQHVALRVSPDQVAGFAERFRRDMQQVFDRGIFYLDNIRLYGDMKEAYDIQKGTVNYLNTVYTVAAFFLFNVFLCVRHLLVSHPQTSVRGGSPHGLGKQPEAGDAVFLARRTCSPVDGGDTGAADCPEYPMGRPDGTYAGRCLGGPFRRQFRGGASAHGPDDCPGHLVPRPPCHAGAARRGLAR